MRNLLRSLFAFSAVLVLLLIPACGDDDESADSGDSNAATDGTDSPQSGTTDTGSGDTESTDPEAGGNGEAAFPSDEFCDAAADFSSAQDGAQRTQALGDMAEAAGADVPAAISTALENLDTGDLPPEVYAAAEDALKAVCD